MMSKHGRPLCTDCLQFVVIPGINKCGYCERGEVAQLRAALMLARNWVCEESGLKETELLEIVDKVLLETLP